MNSQFHESIYGGLMRRVNSINIPCSTTWTPEDIISKGAFVQRGPIEKSWFFGRLCLT
jgi:hypothetical protein